MSVSTHDEALAALAWPNTLAWCRPGSPDYFLRQDRREDFSTEPKLESWRSSDSGSKVWSKASVGSQARISLAPMERTRSPRVSKRDARPTRPIGRTATSPKSSPRKEEARESAPSKRRSVALGDLSNLLGYRIRRAQLWVFKEIGRKLASLEISPAQLSVLIVIDANPGVNQLAVAQVLSIERAGLGRLVDHLEKRGLVTRAASAINRRYYVLYLTSAGAALLGRIRPILADHEKDLARKIGSRAFGQLQRTLSIFLDE
jgi:DNA-binding MarR family transcriptional regulator